MTLDDLNNLNIKDIANWPILPKALAMLVVFAGILFAGYWLEWSNQLAELETAQQNETKLRETFLSKKKQAINLDTYKRQLKEIEQSFGALLKQLPNKSEMDALLTDINQAGLGRGLQFDLFKPAPNETQSEFYAELPITIRLSGSYHDLGAFASDVSQLSRIVTLNDISVTAGKDNLVMEAIAKTFRYLDEEEISAQKKKAKDEKGQKK